ncbi:MAG: lasso peptide biosynthesis B2 protein [Candidatus Melainabacteria bacterium]|nr:lasso peptide biosynthesis B2 protein [Candidatus Melainabacteria bacterium]
MKLLSKFLILPLSEKFLLIKAVILVFIIRIILFIFPIKIISSYINHIIKKTKKFNKVNPPIKNRIIWAIEVACNFIPGTKTCLIKSITGQILLAHYGYESNLCIGVAKNTENKNNLQAHAWLESNGKVILGEHEAEHYKPLLEIN